MDIEYARSMLQAATERALSACAVHAAESDEEKRYFGLIACRARRRGDQEGIRCACTACPALRAILSASGGDAGIGLHGHVRVLADSVVAAGFASSAAPRDVEVKSSRNLQLARVWRRACSRVSFVAIKEGRDGMLCRLFDVVVVSLLSNVGQVAMLPEPAARMLPVLIARGPGVSPPGAPDPALGPCAASRVRFKARLARHGAGESGGHGSSPGQRAVGPRAPGRGSRCSHWLHRRGSWPRSPSDGAPLSRVTSEAFPGLSDSLMAAQVCEATVRVMLICGPDVCWDGPRVYAQNVRALRPHVPLDHFAALFAARLCPPLARLGRRPALFLPSLKLACNA